MANRLIVYNSSGTAQQIIAANLAYGKYPDATLKDVAGITTGNITTYIGTLTADYYTDIFITCTTQTAGGTGLLSFNQVASLRAKMVAGSKGVTVRAGTCQANATVTDIILDSGASAANDYYNGMYIETAGTTAVLRAIADYTGASKTAVVTTTTTAITTSETFVVYTNDHVFELGNTNATTGKTAAFLMWESLYPLATVPLLVSYVGAYKYAYASGTAASAATAGEVTLAGTCAAGDIETTTRHTTVDDIYNGKYIYIYSATTGAWQYAKITNYVASTQIATLDAAFPITPTGTVVYRIVNGVDEVRNDRAVEIYASTMWQSPSSLDTKHEFTALTNQYGECDENWEDAVSQDLDLLAEVLKLGKFAFHADALAIV